MAATSADIVLKLVTGMFGAAPGKANLDYLVAHYNTVGRTALAIELGNSTFFTDLYPTTQGGHAFANAFLANIVPGFDIADPAHLWALNWLAGRFDSGLPVGRVVLDALDALESVAADDPTWGAAHVQWDHWTVLATQLSANTGLDGAPLEELQDALHAPVFSGAEVDGASLVLHYPDLNGLDAANGPDAAAFTVTVGGVARTVQSASVDADAGTVVLALANPVFHGEAVTVAYADPTAGDAHAIQDTVGNEAASLPATAVTNNTADVPDVTGPVLSVATIDGAFLELTYFDASSLDAAHLPDVGAFTVKADGVTIAVSEVQVNPTAKTVILLLASAVTDAQEVTVAYHDPSTSDDVNAVQDIAGNDAHTFAAHDVTNLTPDTTPPVFDAATIDGDTLVLAYTEINALDADVAPPRASSFAVVVGGVPAVIDAVAVDAAANTVTLTLATAATFGQAVTVAYTDPTGGDDFRALQDTAGNDAASLPATAVTNETADAAAPVFASAAVNGATLVMSYTDGSNLEAAAALEPLPSAFTVKVGGVTNAVTAVAVNAGAKTVTLTLTTAATDGQAVTVAYTDSTNGDDTRAIQDAEGNDAASLTAHAVTNNTPDVTAPLFATATVNGSALVMNYTDLHTLDAVNVPAIGAFAVVVGGASDAVTGVVVDANAHTVTLTLTTAATVGQVVTVGYTDPTGGNDVTAIQDASGNDAVTLVGVSVSNLTV